MRGTAELLGGAGLAPPGAVPAAVPEERFVADEAAIAGFTSGGEGRKATSASGGRAPGDEAVFARGAEARSGLECARGAGDAMARIIDGKAAAARLQAELAQAVAAFARRHGSPPGLAVLMVGEHPASRAYVRTKTRVAATVGIAARLVELPEAISTAALLDHLAALAADPAVHGLLVQLPLPAHIDAARVLDAVPATKDVDGFHPANVGALFSAARPDPDRLLIPCTPLGCLHLLQATLGENGLAGSEAVVVGRSAIVGKPLAALLLAADCTVTLAHSRTRDLAAVCRRADILVAAVGRPALIRGDWIRPGATVVDVGINRVRDATGERLVGDVDFAAASATAGAITPVPGGVGPMTVACLMRNTLTAARLQLER